MARRLLASGGTLAVVLAFWAAAPASADLDPVEPGFDDSALVTDLDTPVAVRFAPEPDGRIFVAEKRGVVKAFDAPRDPSPTTVIDLRDEVHDFWDRGLLGMALDPQFVATRRMWLLYSRDGDATHAPPRWGDDCPDPPGATDGGCEITGRLVRVTLDDSGVAGTPVPVIEHQWCAQFPSHTVGTVAFGPDGALYAGAGDGASFDTADSGQLGGNPCGDPSDEGGALRSQDARTPADPQTLDGAIVRVDPLTGEAMPTNPWAGSADANRRRVVAYGMRNPFRFTFRPDTAELWVGDVGWYSREEINLIDPAAPVENLGWPCMEGTERVPEYQGLALCDALSFGEVTAPVLSYAHGEDVVPGDGCDTPAGSSLSGLAFHGTGGYPAAYDGALFFADYARRCIWSLRAGPGGLPDPSTAAVFARGGSSAAVDLQLGPGGDLVYADIGAGEVRRIAYDVPTARLTTSDPTFGPTPLQVTFDAADSSDPKGRPLTYEWDLDGDGSFSPGRVTETETYTARENVNVRVRVTDVNGDQAVDSLVVNAGDRPPRDVRITKPAVAPRWAVGDAIELEGEAFDDDPGDSPTLTWTITMQHCETGGGCHAHAIQSMTGPAARFTAPDHEYPSHLEVRLAATDEMGVTRTAPVLRLDPTTVTLRAEASPRAPVVGVNGAVGSAPPAQTLIAGSKAVLSVVSPQVVDGRTYRFAGWSDGSAELRRTVTVPQDTAYVARFELVPAIGTESPPTVLPDTTRPRLRVLSHRLRLARGRLALRVACPRESCALRVRIRGRRPVKQRALAAGRVATVAMPLPRHVRRALRAGRRVTVRLELSATDAAGNRTRIQRSLRLAGARTPAR